MVATLVDQLIEEFWDWRLKEAPEFATQIGVHDYDDRLDSYSLSGFEDRYKKCLEFLERVESLQQSELSEGEALTLRLLKAELDTVVQGHKYKGFLFPINFLEGVHLELERLVDWMTFETEADYQKLLCRYRHFHKQTQEIRGLLEEGIRTGYVCCKWSLVGVTKQFADLQVAVEKSPFFAPFLQIPKSIDEVAAARLRAEGRRAVEEVVLPSFRDLGQFIDDVYRPAARADTAVSSLPLGAMFYLQCLRYHTTTELSPQEIHKLGVSEVARIEDSMRKVIKKLGLDLSVAEFSDKIRNDRRFYFTEGQQMVNGYCDLVENKINPLLPRLFGKLPRAQLRIKAHGEGKGNSPAAFYLAGSFDGTRPGVFYTNTEMVKDLPRYEMVSLALHEGNPGHHQQASLIIETEDVAVFRRFMEDRRYHDCPSRFPMNTAFIEGWGLYSEYLGEELGLYADPYDEYGRYSAEIMRACRLVVDTGIHALGWSRQEAINYMVKHTAATRQNIENEVNRYITWPGQACAYKIGELKLKELRQRAMKALGSSFDVKRFHDILLETAGPLDIQEEMIRNYVKEVNPSAEF